MESKTRYYKGKRISSSVYTQGRFGKHLREILDTENPYLYAHGRYPTKLTPADLPEDYIKIHSRSLWYMCGFLKTSHIMDMKYTWTRNNHLFKDDYIYISYSGDIKKETDDISGRDRYKDYDIRICGNSIIDIVLAAEKFSLFDTANVRSEIEKKRIWLREYHPEEYERMVGEDKDIFEIMEQKRKMRAI